jgi:F-type H+-transporting ATPase subunit b
MGLDWSTFLLELVNFLILIWILKRFLYAPVKTAIEARRQRVEGVLTEAQAARSGAERLRAEYESREQTWAAERDQARAALEQELAAERGRRLDALQVELQGQREKAAILEARQAQETARRAQGEALALAAGFGSRLLARVADPALEARLVEMVIEDLPHLSETHRQVLAAAADDDAGRVHVQSAFPLSDEQRAALESALSAVAGRALRCTLDRDPDLIAGLRIDAGPLVLRANLRDELRFFAESAP